MLGGYVVTKPRGSAQAVLVSQRGDPLLAQWHYGLGRAIAWTSDSEGRWTAAVNSWDRGGVFWSALVDWTLPPEDAPFQVRGSVSDGEAVLAVEGEVQDGAALTARVVGPDLAGSDVPLRATAPGRYEARFPAAGQGSYLVRVTEKGADGQQRSAIGGLVVPYPPDYADLGAFGAGGVDLLERIAASTGGASLSEARASFAGNLPPAFGSVPLAWWLLMAAAVLLPLDVAARRLHFRRGDLAAWVGPVRARLATGQARSAHAESASPVLSHLRERRTGRVHATTTSRTTTALGESAPLKPPQQDRRARPEREREQEAAPSTERWLEAKRRARRK